MQFLHLKNATSLSLTMALLSYLVGCWNYLAFLINERGVVNVPRFMLCHEIRLGIYNVEHM